jgi:hypothetical protein
MTLSSIRSRAQARSNFTTLDDYFNFAISYLHFIDDPINYQAEIVCQNENSYRFYQYKEDGSFSVTRPINSSLWLKEAEYTTRLRDFKAILTDIRAGITPNFAHKALVSRFVYTTQQTIGAALDSLGVGGMQQSRKLNGEIFEQFIRQLLQNTGVSCKSGVVKVDIKNENNEVLATAKYQHDLLIEQNGTLKIIGSVKTSSKDRIDKIFIDKYLYSKLTDTETPHIAIFLNDVQRGKEVKRTSISPQSYRVSSTFLPGKFKAYTIKLNSLDGVYYCDLRPNMNTDPLLSSQIKSIDELFYGDLNRFLVTAPIAPVTVESESELSDESEIDLDEVQGDLL